MRNPALKLPNVALAAACLLTACSRGDDSPVVETYAFRGATMGTYYSVKVAAVGLGEARLAEVQATIERELDDVDSKMSTWLEDSELSRFNRHAETTPFALSAATFEVLSAALEVARLAGGAYDVTVAPLVDAWGFGAEVERPDPSAEEIGRLLERVGYDQLELDAGASTVRKSRPDVHCDLSSIAKGYAVDRVAEALAALGFGDVWVEVGGEVRAAGRNAEGRIWRLGIERPRLEPGTLQRIMPLDGAAVATSGDYRNYRERDGARISHIIDPRTGSPVRHRLASVSVVSARCMIADAWATALMVLGPEDGEQLARRESLAVLFLVREGEGFGEIMTPAFEALLRLRHDD
jgi:FAD:protein FMN transferase